jgi:PhzF family phenazine biosynthesis protein
MAIKIQIVDAFTDQPYRGNPAGVCVLEQAADERWMQLLARELNLSETAFLLRQPDGSYRLRWFTPVREVDLCGHATLASSHILWESGHLKPEEQARFYTRSGLLLASRKEGGRIELDFPLRPITGTLPDQKPVAEALGVKVRFAGVSVEDVLVEVESERTVRGCRPDFTALAKVEARGIILTSRSENPDYDIVSRFFVPTYGINEDPVTGSAHCVLGPYWSGKLHKNELRAFQASARGGSMTVRVTAERVFLVGRATTVLSGELKPQADPHIGELLLEQS